MNKVRLIITSIISIVLVSMLLIGSTYSIFTTTEIDEELNVYKIGDLNIKYSSNNVKITDVTPMTEEEADAVIPHRITVTNSGNVAYQFDVILVDTTSSETNTIDYQYIMTKVGYLEPKKLSNCTNNIIKEDVILLPGEVVDIDVRVWLSDNLSNSEIGKSFYAKLSIDGQAVYNDNTEIDNDILSLNYMKTSSTNDFRNDKYRTYIIDAFFVDYINTTNASVNSTTNEKIIWDMSEKQDNSVVAWLEDNGTTDDNGNKYHKLYIGSNYNIYAKDLGAFFANMNTLENVSFDNLDTSLTIEMDSMFSKCEKLFSLDLSDFNTSNVINMNKMFWVCRSLTILDLSSFDTSNVVNITYMFELCENLTSLDVSSFDTSKVTNMSFIFSGLEKITELDLSGWDTSKVTNMSCMFQNCLNLTASLIIKNANVINYGDMLLQTSSSSGAKLILNYTIETSSLVDAMIATKSSNSNVVKGICVGDNCPTET